MTLFLNLICSENVDSDSIIASTPSIADFVMIEK